LRELSFIILHRSISFCNDFSDNRIKRTRNAIVSSRGGLFPCDIIDTYRIDDGRAPGRRREARRIARFGTTHGLVGHHHGDELMLMTERGDSSKLINAS